MQAHSDRLTIVDARPSQFSPSVFADPIHLDAKGAAILSDAVGTVIDRSFADTTTRAPLVTLPRYHDTTPDTSLFEDYKVSLVIMKSLGRVR
jgi:hypothetical protein